MIAASTTETQPLTVEKNRKLTAILLYAYCAQPIDFTLFQIRNILLTLVKSPVSKSVETVAEYSEPALLAVAIAAVLTEAWARGKEWRYADKDEALSVRVFFGLAIFKLITVGLFCVNDYDEITSKDDVSTAKMAGLFFIVLFFIEMLISSTMSASLPSTHNMSIAFFLDFFFKFGIFAAAILQYFPQTALEGFFIAAAGFALVAGNLGIIIKHHNAEAEIVNANPEENWLLPVEEDILAPTASHSINVESREIRENIRPSSCMQSFFSGFRERAQNVGPYLTGTLSTTRQPQQ